MEEILRIIRETAIIPVFYQPEAETAKAIVDAAYAGGIRVFEFTNRGPKAEEVFAVLVDHVRQYKDVVLGIGTIMDDATTERFIQLGAHFIVSPVMKPSMAGVCEKYQKLWIPGCATLTEIVRAREAGATLIKIFPGSVLGPGFVKAVLPVIPDLNLMPTGGVEPTEKSLQEWFDAGVYAVGLGSQLLSKEIIQHHDWRKLTSTVETAMKIIQKIRQK